MKKEFKYKNNYTEVNELYVLQTSKPDMKIVLSELRSDQFHLPSYDLRVTLNGEKTNNGVIMNESTMLKLYDFLTVYFSSAEVAPRINRGKSEVERLLGYNPFRYKP